LMPFLIASLFKARRLYHARAQAAGDARRASVAWPFRPYQAM
jgi:hypothetical protein